MDVDESLLLVSEPATGVAMITLNRPESLNALTWPLIDELRRVLSEVHRQHDVRVVVLTGAGRAFCAGSDVGGARGRSDVDIPTRFEAQRRTSGLALAVRQLRQPVIAAINGPAVGAGLGLALATDVRIAGESGSFRDGAIRMGLSACEGGISWSLPRLVGTSNALELMLTNRLVSAGEAERRGIVSAVHPDDELLPAAIDMAAQIAGFSPFGLEATKEAFWANQNCGFGEAVDRENRTQILAVNTADSREAMSAFLEHRKPVFEGR
ncbi:MULTISPECIES: enoyl-CoA hydratase/isomerase family protein [unclassified Rhodococcus (in: high G+C Gram-positive bacteria)]|jgi:enoyl-CoA hydratase|uniref:enoyl-CoA hydratase/isomerase family protein n=1 Tax=unclassified Rhodococcus (in: high G+C Gram-positive bacteria) TaxID=192944 RepID=UPI0013200129|nr:MULTISPECIES: enoyl-CoA hydratase-related protein [unclassified Rhodococcus (in: high G+C Gram-positive bacteria)]QHE70304.1 Enoyl-CoA hydratase [Rhodococcus sp. WAY2]